MASKNNTIIHWFILTSFLTWNVVIEKNEKVEIIQKQSMYVNKRISELQTKDAMLVGRWLALWWLWSPL